MRNVAARACSATTRIEMSRAASSPYFDPASVSIFRMSGWNRSVLNVSVTPWRTCDVRSRPAPVSMFRFESGTSVPSALRS